MSKISVIEFDFILNKHVDRIFPVIIRDDKDMIMIDCGYPGSLDLLEYAALKKGIDLSKLTKIIITHHDFDHFGALAEFKEKYPNIETISSSYDKRFISGEETSLRIVNARSRRNSMSRTERVMNQHAKKKFTILKKVKIDRCVTGGDSFDWCGGIEIISTPGHMPGHISVYLKESKTLVTGDALVLYKGRLLTANPRTNIDNRLAKKSAKKLLNYDIEKIICYHGGEYTKDIKESIERI
jgi:glyoxylase-like metal-dependent hydrolase (beta-lactamase superfamily II)